jgi:hypothetical protein
MSKDVKCPHCGKDNNYYDILTQVGDDLYNNLISVTCSECHKYFQVEIAFVVHKPEFKGTGKCTCNPDDWKDSKPKPVCSTYELDPKFGNCKNCEHDEACH